jgi:hypothetical protein
MLNAIIDLLGPLPHSVYSSALFYRYFFTEEYNLVWNEWYIFNKWWI